MLHNERMEKSIRVLFDVVSPDKISQLYSKYKAVLFPEEKYDELAYLKKTKKFFDKIRGVEFRVKPVAGLRRRRK